MFQTHDTSRRVMLWHIFYSGLSCFERHWLLHPPVRPQLELFSWPQLELFWCSILVAAFLTLLPANRTGHTATAMGVVVISMTIRMHIQKHGSLESRDSGHRQRRCCAIDRMHVSLRFLFVRRCKCADCVDFNVEYDFMSSDQNGGNVT